MRPSPSRAVPARPRENRLKEAGLSGARALTRLIMALIENLGQHDKVGQRREPEVLRPDVLRPDVRRPGWPHGTTRTAFGPTPMGAELERMLQEAPEPAPAPVQRPQPRAPTVTPRATSPFAAAPSAAQNPTPARPAGPDPLSPQPWAAPKPAAPSAVAYARGALQRPPPAPPPAPAPVAPPAPAIAETSTPPVEPPVAPVPIWQRPFVGAPGVRYMRTPDHLLRRARGTDAALLPIVPDESHALPDPHEIGPAESQALATEEGELHIENEASFGPYRGLPRRLKMTSGFAVELPAPANDPMSPALAPALEPVTVTAAMTVALKQPFTVTVRHKATKKAAPAAIDPPAVIEAFAEIEPLAEIAPLVEIEPATVQVTMAAPAPAPARRKPAPTIEWEYPTPELLGEMRKPEGIALTADMLEQNARLLESTLEDFGIRGEIIHVRAGPVVTLYELEPAPGMKSSRVIGLADDIARSMSALSARVAVVPGRNAIGIELPNERRETVYFREMIESEAFVGSQSKLAIALGKTIGGEPVIAELAKMPHLLVAGTTGSGKSVAINTMILSLLYRLKPEECRLIMVDPKMLELSVYDGIPHLLTPVVTDPKKAVVALKWAVREMEDRYKKMSKLGVRNIDGFNKRVGEAKAAGETVMMQVTTGFDKETGRPVIAEQPMDLTTLPYIVVIVDEMADLMMVAGKDIEGAIQRLAQMARAAGIHLIMATQRPSVDVITGTIKANFPTRISFQVTSKIDSRTILGEQGAEQLLGQGDMLHMQGGGRIYRVHGPFVSDEDVERVVAHLKRQRAPDYLDSVTDDIDAETDEDEDAADAAVFDKTAMGGEEDGDLYEQAVKIVLRDKKCSVSYVQRRLQVGYNKAASLVERMEKDGILSPASHTGKREILAHSRARVITGVPAGDEED